MPSTSEEDKRKSRSRRDDDGKGKERSHRGSRTSGSKSSKSHRSERDGDDPITRSTRSHRSERDGDDPITRSTRSHRSRRDDDASESHRSERDEDDAITPSTSKSRSHRSRRDEDARAKERARRSSRSSGGASRPGVESVKDAPGDSREDRKARRDRRSREDEDAKKRARGSRSSGSSSKPGVSHERNSSDRARHKGRESGGGSSRPSRNRDEKKGYKNSGAASPGVKSERNNRSLSKKMEAMEEGKHNETNLVASNVAGEDEYAVEAEMVEEVDEDTRKAKEAARIKKMVEEEASRIAEERDQEAARQREEEDRRQEEIERKKRKRRKMICVVVVLLLLIGGGVGAFFALKGGGEEVTSTNMPVVTENNATLSPSLDPSESPSTNPSNSPTIYVKYPPPNDGECQRLATGLDPIGVNEMVPRDFDVNVELGLSSADTDIDSLLPEVQQKIEEWLVPPLVGCPVQRRFLGGTGATSMDTDITTAAAMRKLQSPLDSIRYMVADVDVTVTVTVEVQDCEIVSSPKCVVVRVILNVLLKGDERNFNVELLLLEFFPRNIDLKPIIGLPDAVDVFVSRSITATSPTTPPSAMPTGKPTIMSATPLPTVTASSNPTSPPVQSPVTSPPVQSPVTSPPVLSPGTSEPTKATTKVPTTSPIEAATPAPTTKAPTKAPTPPPTLAPTIMPFPGVTPRPTTTPSKAPSASPSQTLSNKPSRGPSESPTSAPTNSPTFAPTPGPACNGNNLESYAGGIVTGTDGPGWVYYVVLGEYWSQHSFIFVGKFDSYLDESKMSARYSGGSTYSGCSPRHGEVYLHYITSGDSYTTFGSNGAFCGYRADIYVSTQTCELPGAVTAAPANACNGNTLESYAGGIVTGVDGINNGDDYYLMIGGRWDERYGNVLVGSASSYHDDDKIAESYTDGHDGGCSGERRGDVYLHYGTLEYSVAIFWEPSPCNYRSDIFISVDTCALPDAKNSANPNTPVSVRCDGVTLETLEGFVVVGSLGEYSFSLTLGGAWTQDSNKGAQTVGSASSYHTSYNMAQSYTGGTTAECGIERSGDVQLHFITTGSSYVEFNEPSPCYYTADIYVDASSCTLPPGPLITPTSGAQAKMSSEYFCNEPHCPNGLSALPESLAYRAIDGNTDGNHLTGQSMSHTWVQYNPWWRVDFSSAKDVAQVVVWNRNDSCGGCENDIIGSEVELLDENDNVLASSPITTGDRSTVHDFGPVVSSVKSVRVMQKKDDQWYYMYLSEVQVFGLNSEDLVATDSGVAAWQSSDWYCAITCPGAPWAGVPATPAENAIDGNFDQAWAGGGIIHTAAQYYPWWMVELGFTATVHRVKVWNRSDYQDNMLNFFVELLDNTGGVLHSQEITTVENVYTFEYPDGVAGVSAMRLKLYERVFKHLYFAEFEAFGYRT